MAKVKNGSSAESEQTVIETVVPEGQESFVQEHKDSLQPEPEVNTPLTDDEMLAKLDSDLSNAKKVLNDANAAADFKETPETLACEGKVNVARKALNDFNKTLAAKKNEADFNEKLTMAMADVKEKLNLTDERLNELLTNSKDVKDTLKQSFNLVFGPVPVFAKQGATSKSLTTSAPRETNGVPAAGNVNDIVKSLFDSGLTHDEILGGGHEEGRIRNVAYKVDYAKDKSTGKYSKRAR